MLSALSARVRRRSLTLRNLTTRCFFGMEVDSQTLSVLSVKVWESRLQKLLRLVIFSVRVCILLTSQANLHHTADQNSQMALPHLSCVKLLLVSRLCCRGPTVMPITFPLDTILPRLKVASIQILLVIKPSTRILLSQWAKALMIITSIWEQMSILFIILIRFRCVIWSQYRHDLTFTDR